MGVEHSRAVAHQSSTSKPFQCSRDIHYTRADVAVWPHLAPLAQWFTVQDALALNAKLRRRTSTSMLDLCDFVTWLQNDQSAVALQQPTMPVHDDILTPPPLLLECLPALASKRSSSISHQSTTDKHGSIDDPETSGMLEMYLAHIFHAFKGTKANKVYALEVLAALTLVSRAIWRLDDKVSVLMTLFYDPALSARHAVHCGRTIGSSSSASPPSKCFKETDVAQLLLCVMRGVAKATIGVSAAWDAHGLRVAAMARQLAAMCMQDAIAVRAQHQQQCCAMQHQQQPSGAVPSSPKRSKAASSPTRRCVHSEQRCACSITADNFTVQGGISEHEFRRFVADRPVVRRFVALFAAEQLRNPLTFAPPCSFIFCDRASNAAARSQQQTKRSIEQQTQLYDALLQHYITFDGRETQRQLSAALLLQTSWRRWCAQQLLAQHKQARAQQCAMAAVTLQRYVRQRQFATLLERHAVAERTACNGGVFVAGAGPCVPLQGRMTLSSGTATRHHPALAAPTSSPTPFCRVDAFKYFGVRIRCVAASPTCALALADDRRTLFAWGRCLPNTYACDDKRSDVRLFQPTPARLAYAFADAAVEQLACGLQHALARTSDGMVYSWGMGDHGQLGHGTNATLAARTNGHVTYDTYYDERTNGASEYLATPLKLLYFEGSVAQLAAPIPIAQICCGDYYCLALSRDGDVFTWGEASEGQLGHGDAHQAFDVAFVDPRLLHSAFTYLAEPEPVLALSDVAIAHVACGGNHSVALATDGRVFEWGNWGLRCGRDVEHAFVPVETVHARPLRLRQVAVGDHHIVAEGCSVWMTLAGGTTSVRREGTSRSAVVQTPPVDDIKRPQDPEQLLTGFYVACASYSCSLDAFEQRFVGRLSSKSDNKDARPLLQWTCTLIDLDVDDLDDDDDERARDVDSVKRALDDADRSNVDSLWRTRARPFVVSSDSVGRFDTRAQLLVSLASREQQQQSVGATTSSYALRLNTWLRGHVDDRIVVLPRGKPAGLYVQFLVPHDKSIESTATASNERPGAMNIVEFRVCGSLAAQQLLSKRGVALHIFDPAMDGANRTLLQRKQLHKQSTHVTEVNGLYVLEVDASVCLPIDTADAKDDTNEQDALRHRLLDSALAARVLAAQEAGALAVLVVLAAALDTLVAMESFALELADATGVYIPVLVVHALAVATDDAGRPHRVSTMRMTTPRTMHALLQRMRATTTHAQQQPPVWTARCFRRVDTLNDRIDCALANGAAGVLVVQDAASPTLMHSSLDVAVLEEQQQRKRLEHQLVAMISSTDGERLRECSSLSPCLSSTPSQLSLSLLQRERSSADAAGVTYALLVDVCFALRPGGSVYAWGNASHGRLGLGDRSGAIDPELLYQDGYDARTDTTYRYVEYPTLVAALAGVEMQQLACGAAHSLALSSQRNAVVFAWGRSSARGAALDDSINSKQRQQRHNRQVRQASESADTMQDCWTPTPVRGLLKYESIAQVVATDASSLAVSESVAADVVYDARRQAIKQLRAVERKSVR